ncbi:MAG: STAS domain-containing protein [Rhodocyclaceae bacterium]
MSTFSCTETVPGTLVLEGEFTIFDAAQARITLLDKLSARDALTVDLSGVTELDSSGVQLMLLLAREAGRADKTVTWEKHSNAVAQVLDTLNLSAQFNAPAAVVWS